MQPRDNAWGVLLIAVLIVAFAAFTPAQETLVLSENFEDTELGTLPGWIQFGPGFGPGAHSGVGVGSDGDLCWKNQGEFRNYAVLPSEDFRGQAVRVAFSFRIPPGGSLAVLSHSWANRWTGVALADSGGYGMFPRVWDSPYEPRWNLGPERFFGGKSYRRSDVADRELPVGQWCRGIWEAYPNRDGFEEPYLAWRYKAWPLTESQPEGWDNAGHAALPERNHALLAISSVAGGGFELDNLQVWRLDPFESLPSRIDTISHLLTNRPTSAGPELHARIAWVGPYQLPGTPTEPRIYEADGSKKWCIESANGARFVKVRTPRPTGGFEVLQEGSVWLPEGPDAELANRTEAYASTLQ